MALFRQSVARPRKPWPVALAVVFVLATILTAFAVGGGPLGRAAKPAYGATLGTGGGTAQTIGVAKPIRATIQWSKTVPARSAAEQQAEARALALHSQLKAAPVGPHPAASQVADPRTVNAPLAASKPAAKPAQTAPGGPKFGGSYCGSDSCFDVENQSYQYGGSGVCPTDCATSDTAEPSVGNDGKHIMESFNWGTAVSHDNAGTWGHIDPYTLFSGIGIPNFCCDQQVLYEPSRDRMWWEALFFGGFGSAANGLVLWSSAGTDLSTWCGYHLTGPTFGQASGTLLDYPQIDFSANFIYLTFNSYDGSGSWISSTVTRLALTVSSTCGALTGSFTTRTDNFAYALAQGATDTMYWDSNWYTGGSCPCTGSSVRIFFWPEGSGSYTYYDKSIPSWTFFGEGSVSCASSDGVVTDWCGRLDPRRGTLFRSRAGFKGFGAPMLGMGWTSGPVGCTIGGGVAYPYVVVYYFLLSTLAYKAEDNFFTCATSAGAYGVAYPSMAAPTQRGYIGGDFSFGGGTGGSDTYPGNFYSIQDPDIASAPGSDYFWPGFGNAADTGWGDYNTVRPWNPDGLHWMSEGWVMQASISYPFIFIFGKGRDHNAYLRWSTT